MRGRWAVLLAFAFSASAEPLEHNPFARPTLGAEAPTGETVAASRPVLRATLTGGEEPLVNVDGRLLAVGDDINGYRLLRVEEGAAEFLHGEERVRVELAEPRTESGTRQ